MRRIFCLILLITFFVLPTFVSAEDFYVTSTGAGSQDGSSWDNAWSWSDLNSSGNWSSSDESGKVDAGDTVYISGGSSGVTYTSDLTIPESGENGRPITIKPGQDASHNGLVTLSGARIILSSNVDYITINGQYGTGTDKYGAGARHIKIYRPSSHAIDGRNGGHTGLKVLYVEIEEQNYAGSGVHAIYVSAANTSTGIEIAYNYIHGAETATSNYNSCDSIKIYNDDSGAYGGSSIHHNKIIELVDDGIETGLSMDIYDNYLLFTVDKTDDARSAGNHPDGVLVHGTAKYMRIYNNFIANFDQGLFWEGRNDTNGPAKIYNNIFVCTDSKESYSYKYKRGIVIVQNEGTGTIENILIANNNFVDLWSGSIRIRNHNKGAGDINNITIINNIIRSGIRLQHTKYGNGSYSNNICDYNLFDDGIGTITWEDSSQSISTIGSNNSQGDPIWVSYSQYDENNDYHLQSNDTNAMEKGLSIPDFSGDKDGTLRPQGSAWDIGPYEYELATSAPQHLRIITTSP